MPIFLLNLAIKCLTRFKNLLRLSVAIMQHQQPRRKSTRAPSRPLPASHPTHSLRSHWSWELHVLRNPHGKSSTVRNQGEKPARTDRSQPTGAASDQNLKPAPITEDEKHTLRAYKTFFRSSGRIRQESCAVTGFRSGTHTLLLFAPLHKQPSAARFEPVNRRSCQRQPQMHTRSAPRSSLIRTTSNRSVANSTSDIFSLSSSRVPTLSPVP